ncbi:aminoacyl-tRNA hydrolase [Synechocystis sp. PCC 7339]|uniref:aminoacyl-tRNA hydrolase n=1 Tax=Synechocystis sp. PCC 7339 TaxID=2782213 RepID=UPI001CBD139A|nr:aminoacyl-tRNA hydrolase [Synechocystis sp. PCC 7339]UAJ71898.1 aminoacyl-tRNA hydrolase [Synechocystis sp. PCC 7339]
MIPKLIVGLGNPEPKYDQTRHNIGFAVVDALAIAWQCSWYDHKRFQGWFGEGLMAGQKTCLLKPRTYMNRSGQAARAVVDWYKLEPQSVLVVYDDMDLPLGRLRLRQTGSAGGHNGMKSLISHLGTQDFPRLRLGIGKSDVTKDTIAHVLGKFTPSELPIVEKSLDLATEAIAHSLHHGIAKTMSLFNNRNVAP